MDKRAFFDELCKLGAISDADAQKSVDRLETLEKAKPTAGQVGRYGALGAGAGMLSKAVGHGIEHGKLPSRRGMLGAAVTGAIGMGAVPLIRSAMDRHVEKGHLKQYLKQEEVPHA